MNDKKSIKTLVFIILILVSFISTEVSYSQIGIGTTSPDGSAILTYQVLTRAYLFLILQQIIFGILMVPYGMNLKTVHMTFGKYKQIPFMLLKHPAIQLW